MKVDEADDGEREYKFGIIISENLVLGPLDSPPCLQVLFSVLQYKLSEKKVHCTAGTGAHRHTLEERDHSHKRRKNMENKNRKITFIEGICSEKGKERKGKEKKNKKIIKNEKERSYSIQVCIQRT